LQSEDTWMELHVLHRHGWSIAALAREFGLDWRTARRYATADGPPRYRPRVRPAELTAACLAHVERRLTACPDLRATVLHRELVEGYGYSGSYTSLRRRVVELRPTDAAEPEIRFETGPGIQTQGDWTDCGVWPLGDGSVELYAFVAILGYSRMLGVRFATDKTRPTTLRSIVRCVDDLGGASAEFLTDRDTALMNGSRADGSPIYAPDWVDVAALLGTRPRACRPYRAKTKGKDVHLCQAASSARSGMNSVPAFSIAHRTRSFVRARAMIA
jgi:transposase